MMTNDERKQKAREAGEHRAAIARAVVSAHQQRDAAKLGEHFADDAESTWVGHRPAKELRGRQDITRAWEALWKVAGGLSPRLDLVLVSENHAVAFVALAPKATDPAGGNPGKKPRLSPDAAFSWYFTDWEKGDHCIRSEEVFFDASGLERATTSPAAAPAAAGETGAAHVSSDSDPERVHLAVVNAMNTGLKVRDLDAAMQHYSEGATVRVVSEHLERSGRAGVRTALQERFAAAPNAKLERLHAWCAGKWVVAEYRWASAADGPAGRDVAVRELHLFEVEADKIEAHWILGQPLAAALSATGP